MNKDIILTVIGPDKSGIVLDISEIIKNHSGNIEKSRMTRLGNFFTIMMLVNIEADNIKELNNVLNNYSNYQISIQQLRGNTKEQEQDNHIIHLNGLDNEGLVYNFTKQLALMNINIEELKTNIDNAPMSGLTLFSLTAKISHSQIDYKLLTKKMNDLANELDVNISIED